MSKQIEISPRQFKGELPDMKQPKDVRVHNQKALKAYLKGKRQFRNGFKDFHNFLGEVVDREPAYFITPIQDRVLQK